MILNCAIALTLCTLTGGTTSHLGVAPDFEPNGFFERFLVIETELQLDQGDVIHAKDKKAPTAKLASDIELQRKHVASALADPSLRVESGREASNFRDALSVLTKQLSSLRSLVTSAGVNDKQAVRQAWYDHGQNFRMVLVAIRRIPGFSPEKLSAPTRYNLTPVLFDKSEGVVFADAKSPQTARIARTFGTSVRGGDEIIAYRDDEDSTWTPVATWKDIFHRPKDVGEDEITMPIILRLRRGANIREAVLSYVVKTYSSE